MATVIEFFCYQFPFEIFIREFPLISLENFSNKVTKFLELICSTEFERIARKHRMKCLYVLCK